MQLVLLTLTLLAQSGTGSAALLEPLDDPLHLAFHAPTDAPTAATLSVELGVQVRDVQSHGPRDWHLVELGSSLSAPVRAAAVERLLALPAVDYATTVGTCGLGLPTFPMPAILVSFEPAVPDAEQAQRLAVYPDLVIDEPETAGLVDTWRVRSLAGRGADVLARVRELSATPGVRWAEPDRVLGLRDHAIPDDPNFDDLWGIHNVGQDIHSPTGSVLGTALAGFDMDVLEAWDETRGSSSVIVVVMDNGAEPGHPDLDLGFSADVTGSGTGGAPVNACCFHGTAVAGCVGGQYDNGLGAIGVAPGCTTASVSISIPNCPNDGTSQTTTGWFIAALAYAEQIGARVTNASFSSGLVSASWEAKYASTRAAGIFHVASSGNDGVNTIAYPASITSVCAIGAVQMNGQLADYGGGAGSNTGTGQQFVAPGKSVITTDRVGFTGYSTGDYSSFGGTSAAAPYAAGVAALVISLQPSLTPSELEYILEASCTDLGAVGYDTTFGYGLLNARRAMQIAKYDLAAMRTDLTLVFPGITTLVDTIAEAVGATNAGGLILAQDGMYDEVLLITQPLTLRRWDGDVVVGQ